MPSVLERVSTITEKGQTTIPKVVRDALGVSYGGKIVFRVDENGVSLRPADDEDPSFLSFLAKDMHDRPDVIAALPSALAQRILELTEGREVDPDEEIEGTVAPLTGDYPSRAGSSLRTRFSWINSRRAFA